MGGSFLQRHPWLRRALIGAGAAAVSVGTYDYYNYYVLSRSARTLVYASYLTYLYKTTTPRSRAELNALHEYATDCLLYLCRKNEGLYIKLGQGIASLNNILPDRIIAKLSVLLDQAPNVEPRVIEKILATELRHCIAAYKSRHPQPDDSLLLYYSSIDAERATDAELVHHFFYDWSEQPVASASIAQVHRARVVDPEYYAQRHKDGGVAPAIEPYLRPVAVKIQKPNISKQIYYDMACHHIISFMIETVFGIPMLNNSYTIEKQLQEEINFINEANNAAELRQYFTHNPDTPGNNRADVYIPYIYPFLLTPKVMVAEWINGVKLSEAERLEREVFGAAPGAAPIATKKAIMQTLIEAFGDMIYAKGLVHCDPHAANIMIRPRVPRTGPAAVSHQPSSRFGTEAQQSDAPFFQTNYHDFYRYETAPFALPPAAITPGPGLLTRVLSRIPILRQLAHRGGYDYEVVLLDFGLCQRERPRFRNEYALFFKYIYLLDLSSINRIVAHWGIGHGEVFASMVLQRPMRKQHAMEQIERMRKRRLERERKARETEMSGKDNASKEQADMRAGDAQTNEEEAERAAKMGSRAKAAINSFFRNEKLIPEELLFLGRCLNILRSLNKSFGSPINRTNVLVARAVRALAEQQIWTIEDLDGPTPGSSLRNRYYAITHYARVIIAMQLTDLLLLYISLYHAIMGYLRACFASAARPSLTPLAVDLAQVAEEGMVKEMIIGGAHQEGDGAASAENPVDNNNIEFGTSAYAFHERMKRRMMNINEAD